MIQTGCCGFAAAHEEYFGTFPLIEIQKTFYQPPRVSTAERWRKEEAPEEFFRPEWKREAVKTCEENSAKFLVGGLGWGLFERSWNLRGFENALMDAAVNTEFYEEVARLRWEMGRGGGHILAPAKPLQPDTPTENAIAVVEAFADEGR
jgi:hypothetical protein